MLFKTNCQQLRAHPAVPVCFTNGEIVRIQILPLRS